MPLRELALHRVMVHHDDARVAARRPREFGGRARELLLAKIADDRDIAEVPRERLGDDAVRGVQADDRRAGDAHDGLDGLADVLPVFPQQLQIVTHPQRREPPRHVVIAGHDDHLADALAVLEEGTGALELAGPGALREVAGDRDDVVALLLDERLDRLVLLRHRGMTEVEIGGVKEADRGWRHRRAMMASVKSSVPAEPPRSRVTVLPSRITFSSAARTRTARSPWPRCSRSMHPASINAPGFAIPFPAMSGAVPWTASKMAPWRPMLPPGASPSPPTSPEI